MKTLGILLCVLAATAYCQAAEYEISDLGTLGGATSVAWDINDAGQVVGWADTESAEQHAFLWTATDGMIDLGTLGGAQSGASAINGAGQVTGSAQTEDGSSHAFLWTPDDGMIDLGTLGGAYSSASAINGAGQVTGSALTESGAYHAFLWTPEDGMIDLGTFGGEASQPAAINDAGQVTGWALTESGAYHAFLWTPDDGMIDLGMGHSYALDINNAGQVVGYRYEKDWVYPFLWTPELGEVPLPLFATQAEAICISDAGQIVGECDFNILGGRVFILSPGVSMVLSNPPDMVSSASAQNEAGAVVGYLCPPYVTKELTAWAFVWTVEGGRTELPALEGAYSRAFAINAGGQIVGGARVAPGSMYDHACLWQPVVLTPAEQIVSLVDLVEGLNFQEGINNSLDAKLDAALNALDDVNQHNDIAAINSLEAFINAVEAQRGKKISEADADALIAAAEEIILLLMEGA